MRLRDWAGELGKEFGEEFGEELGEEFVVRCVDRWRSGIATKIGPNSLIFAAKACVEVSVEIRVKIFGIPTAEVSSIDRCIFEHVLHATFAGFVLGIADCGGVPIAEVLVKETSPFKHAAHVGDIAGVPLANRFLASVIENVGIGEHGEGIGDAAVEEVLSEVLIEEACTAEHAVHGGQIVGIEIGKSGNGLACKASEGSYS